MAAETRIVEEEFQESLAKRIRLEENPKTVRDSGEKELLEEHTEELSETEKLRRNIQCWLNKYPFFTQQTVVCGIGGLLRLKKAQGENYVLWQEEVLYLRSVQKYLVSAVRQMREMGKRGEELGVAKKLRTNILQVLRPCDKIQPRYFPEVREITENLADPEGNLAKSLHAAKSSKQLFRLIKNTLKHESFEKNIDTVDVVKELELIIRAYSLKRDDIYQYLLCVNVCQLFGFTVNGFVFKYQLTISELKSMEETLESCLHRFNALHSVDQKQAYLLNLALNCVGQKQSAVQHILDKISSELCADLKEACTDDNVNLDFQKLHDAGCKLSKEFSESEVEFLVQSTLSQFHFLEAVKSHDTIEDDPVAECAETNIRREVKELLELLGIADYYPQKLTFQDVIKLTSDVHNDVNTKPGSRKEVAWYFLRHIMRLDSDTRENCSVATNKHFESDDSDDDDEATSGVNPLDLIYAIFLCADDVLRQELTDRMSKCQYAVPYILPSPESGKNQNRSTLVHWGLSGITRNFYHDNRNVDKTLVEMKAPLITCVSFGEDTWWKSKLFNQMLSPQQEAFWHPGLKNGSVKQTVSEGMVEVGWHLPGAHGDNVFPHPVVITNIRQSAEHLRDVHLELMNLSSVFTIFTEEINQDTRSFLETHRDLEKIILIVLHEPDKRQIVKEQSQKLQEQFRVKKIIRKTNDYRNISNVSDQLKESIQAIFASNHVTSLSDIASEIKNKNLANVDDNHHHSALMAAQSILRDVDQHNRKGENAKAEILPWSSDLKTRQEIAANEKEFCRQKKKRENTTVQNYACNIKKNQVKLQLLQLKQPVSDTFKYFLLCLLNITTDDRRYFVQSLKLGLNKRSVELLQPLRWDYQKHQVEDKSNERDARLKTLDEQLTHGSLGIEHFFREMAVVYDNVLSLRNISANRYCKEINNVLELLACLMAELLMDGVAIEIMDGDAVNVPVDWLGAVLDKVENNSHSKLFKVSALGAQSCGKSTVLNTVFGLNFPVSSGRCTRGAYLQLVKVDESMKETLYCDYVAVIDTEGLMSRSKVDGTEYDNELSTFIIGLSDLTLVIIKGEGNEMNDVLPLAIHAFLRMNIVGLGQYRTCHFVHQNMAAADAESKIVTEIEAFVNELNTKTKVAAGEVNRSDKYTKFSDVLQCDPIKDNTFVPVLWYGAPPMAKYSTHFSRTMQILKQKMLNLPALTKAALATFTEMSELFKEIWQGIKYETFVLSFRNVLTIEAHGKLTKIFHEAQWALKREVQDLMMQVKNRIENEVLGYNATHSEREVAQHIQDSAVKMTEMLDQKTSGLGKEIKHYFQCDGCEKCSGSVTNRHFLRDYEKKFTEEVHTLQRTLNELLRDSMKKFEINMKMERWIRERDASLDDIIKAKVREAIRNGRSEDLSREDINDSFDKLWSDVTADIIRTINQEPPDENIEAKVQTSIKDILGTDHQYYLQMLNRDSSKQAPKATTFEVDRERHMNLIVGASPASVTDADVNRLQVVSESILRNSEKHYECTTSSGGKQFHSQLADDLFLDVKEEMDNICDGRIRVTWNYKTDLLFHIQTLAVAGFTQMQDTYRSQSSPEALLQRKKKSYRDLYAIKMGHGNAASDFSENFLKDLVLRNTEEQLSCSELLNDLKKRCGDIFRDVKSVQGSIMVDLYLEDNFEKYLKYIESYECHVKEKLEFESIKHFTKGRFFEMAEERMDQIISAVLAALSDAVNNSTRSTFIKTFLSKIGNLKVSHSEAAAYLELDVPKRHEFACIVKEQLETKEGRLNASIRRTIGSWNVQQKIKDKQLTKFVFEEIVGCTARCPFCKVPCDTHSNGKTGGKHASTVHRPAGIGGFHWLEDGRLTTQDCRLSIASQQAQFRNPETRKKWHNYKDYLKIYPDWSIRGHPDCDPDFEKYWKWVFARHNSAFAKFHAVKEADIPPEWANYEKREIAEELESNYQINVPELK